jgi:hypothetical protein
LTFITVPIKGTVLEVWDGKHVIGDDEDVIRPAVSLGIPWRLVSLDIEKELAVVKVDLTDFDLSHAEGPQARIDAAVSIANSCPRIKRLVRKDR